MGTYRADRNSVDLIVLRHEGEDDHSIEIHGGARAPVPAWLLGSVTQGMRYVVNLSFTEYIIQTPPTEPPAPLEVSRLPAWAVQPDPARLRPREAVETVSE